VPASLFIRYIIVILFVAVYIALGYVFQLNAQAYLLSGIPLTVFFQLVIAKQPIHKLWMRNEEKFTMNPTALLIAIGLMVWPTYKIIHSIEAGNFTLVSLAYDLATLSGAFAAGFAFSRLTKKTIKELFICLGIVLLIKGITIIIILIWAKPGEHPDYITGITSLLTYIPIAFIVEEVVFRGMLDSYIYSSQKSAGIWPVFFISALWALWHLPLSSSNETILFISIAALINTGIWGIPLSVFWRRTGNLAVPVFSHAFIDAIRDALM
jgi:membrane protease YdiL (CAAX protease family)